MSHNNGGSKVRSASPGRLARDPAVFVGLLVLVGYLATARLVENLYPFSTFPMYAGERSDSASRLVAREADGSVHEASEYAAWSCEEEVDLSREHDRCGALPRYSTIPYIDREIVESIRSRSQGSQGASGAGVHVTIVRRVFRFPDGPGAPSVEDCEVGRCKAVRRR